MWINRRFYTFIVANHADAKLRRLSLPFPALLMVAFFAIVGMITAGIASYNFGLLILKVKNYGQLQAQNDLFTRENQNFRLQTAQLGEKIDFLETLAQKLTSMSGMNAEGSVGGVGGYSRASFRKSDPASAAGISSFEGYDRSVARLEDRYRRIRDFLSAKILLASSVPDRMPVKGYVSGAMGMRDDPFHTSGTEDHTGLDISAPYGSPVHAPADGIVVFAGQREGYGNLVMIDHRFGTVTRYGHLSRINVKVGQGVFRSDVIGNVGTSGRTTGPHLHYEVWQYNVNKNPLQFLSHTEAE